MKQMYHKELYMWLLIFFCIQIVFSAQDESLDFSKDNTNNYIRKKKSVDYYLKNDGSDYRTLAYDSSRQCDVYLLQGEGNITSDKHLSSLECIYRIPRIDSSSCALELVFHNFNLDTDGSKCDRDYFLVGSKRYCGIIAPGTSEYVEFPYGTNEVAFKFVLNKINSNSDFCIQVKRNYKHCTQQLVEVQPNLSVKQVSGRLTSYGYPDYYRETTNCTYIIERQPGFCSVELEFVDFDLEEGSYSPNYLYKDCQKVYFLMEGRKYCGDTLTGKKIVVDFHNSNEIPLIFVSQEGRRQHRGIDIRYTQLPCPTTNPVLAPIIIQSTIVPQHNCKNEYSSHTIFIQNANYPNNYLNNQDCTYIIKRSSNDICELEITFVKFDLEYDRLCRGDYLEINGGKLCGPLPDGTAKRVKFYGSEMIIKFHSDDSVNKPGFKILIEQKSDCSSLALTKLIPVRKSFYCDEVRSVQEFYIQSLNHHAYQSNLLDCAYTIRPFTSSVCGLSLTFLKFNLEDNLKCDNSYLEVAGQRFCGSAHQGTTKEIKFDKPEIVIRYHIDGSNKNQEFQLFAQQQRECAESVLPTQIVVSPKIVKEIPIHQPSCDAMFTSGQFQMTSLNYPNNYYNDMQCILRIQRLSNDVCNLQMTFNSFDLEMDDGCRYDYLEIGGQRLCGTVSNGVIKLFAFDGPEMFLRFKSDHTHTHKGFDIGFKQIANCNPTSVVVPSQRIIIPYLTSNVSFTTQVFPSIGCDHTFTTWEFYFQSVHFPLNYGNNLDCTYRALKFSPSVCEIELHFMSFDIEFHENCMNDYLEVQGERICGTIASGSIRKYKFDGQKFVIRFHSNHETSGVGFNILVRQKTSCPVAAPPNVVPVIPLQKILLVPTKTALINKVVHPKLFPPVYNIHLTQSSSQIMSFNYPTTYSFGINCTYRISRNKGVCAIELYFNDFDVEFSYDCKNDYLSFGGRRYCGTELKGQTRMLYFEKDSEAVMNFVSDNSGDNGKGWWTFYRQIACNDVSATFIDTMPDLCDHIFNQEMGFIKSQGYPLSTYPTNEDCYYRILRAREDICLIELSFTDFRLESSTDCTNDYLEINRQRYCGSELMHKILYVYFPVGSDEILLHLKSNDIHEDQGFFIQARQLSFGCSQTFNLPVAVPQKFINLSQDQRCQIVQRAEIAKIESPGFPLPYSPNTICTYTIERINSEICGLEMDVLDFSLEYSHQCLYDYLQSPTGDRMCGNLWAGVSRRVAFPSNKDKLVFIFYSDSKIGDKGFSINIRQINHNCP